MKTKSFFAVLFGILTISVLVFYACKKEQKDPSPPTYTDEQVEIGEIGGVIKVTDQNSSIFGIELTVPAGALKTPNNIKITESKTISEDFFIDNNNVIFHFEPKGISFEKPVQISIPFNGSINEKSKALYLNEETNEYIEMPIISVNNGKIIFTTNHFSDYIATNNGVICGFDMFKIDGKVGLTVNLYEAVTEDYFNIPTFYYYGNIINDVYSDNGIDIYEKQSLFKVNLYKGDEFGDELLETITIGARMQIGSSTMEYAIVYKDDQNNGLYSSIWSSDYHDFGEYFNAEALVFSFDYPTNEDDKYYANAQWALTQTHSFSNTYTGNYHFNNFEARQKFSALENRNIDTDNNYINDSFQDDLSPMAQIIVNPQSGPLGTVFTFNANGSSDMQDPTASLLVRWDWEGDGIWDTEPSTEKEMTHTYQYEGQYEATVKVIDTDGYESEASITVLVGNNNLPPSCTVTSPSQNEAFYYNEEVGFIVTAEDNDGTINRVELLDFSGMNTIVIDVDYEAPYELTFEFPAEWWVGGWYMVGVIAYDDSETASQLNEIYINAIGQIRFAQPNNSSVYTIGQTNVNIQVGATTYSDNIFDLYKGETFIQHLATMSWTVNEFPIDIPNYIDAGDDYRIKGTRAEDEVWSFFSDYFTIVEAIAPVADFTADALVGNAPLTVNFTDQSSNIPTSWLWDFGDGETSTQTDPSHTYSIEGSYTVTLTVTNSYGSDIEIKTNYIVVSSGGGTGTFTDPRDGQTYTTIDIGSQTWFAENLNHETTNSWWYDNSSSNGDVYGRLYTWDAALTACPSGWHLPSIEEWQTLRDFIGGSPGGNMKETGTTHWYPPNTGATNSSGFTALGGGFKSSNISFTLMKHYAVFWSGTEYSSTTAYQGVLYNDQDSFNTYSRNKANANSVRCIKD
jgi:uncharacterized protein (TIGR02145 family)